MLGINERGRAARFLRLRDHLQRQRGFSGRLRPKNFHHAAARESAHAQSCIERYGAAGDHRDRQHIPGTEPQHGAFSELLVHLAEGGINGALARGGVYGNSLIFHDILVARMEVDRLRKVLT